MSARCCCFRTGMGKHSLMNLISDEELDLIRSVRDAPKSDLDLVVSTDGEGVLWFRVQYRHSGMETGGFGLSCRRDDHDRMYRIVGFIQGWWAMQPKQPEQFRRAAPAA